MKTEAGLPLTNGRVMVTVGGSVFTTTTDPAGNYKLELYSESDDAFVRITAEGRIGTERLEWQIYEGNISGLRGNDGLLANEMGHRTVRPQLRPPVVSGNNARLTR